MPDVEKFKTIEKGNDSAITRREEYAINDQPNWERFWQEHKNDPNAKPPKVNFRNKMVVAIFMGQKPSGGYENEVLRVESSNKAKDLQLYVKEISPSGDTATTQQLNQPYHIVEVLKNIGIVQVAYAQLQVKY